MPLALARQIPTHYTIGEIQTVHLKWMDFISTKLILKNQKKTKQTNQKSLLPRIRLHCGATVDSESRVRWSDGYRVSCSGWRGQGPYAQASPTRTDHSGETKEMVWDSVP